MYLALNEISSEFVLPTRLSQRMSSAADSLFHCQHAILDNEFFAKHLESSLKRNAQSNKTSNLRCTTAYRTNIFAPLSWIHIYSTHLGSRSAHLIQNNDSQLPLQQSGSPSRHDLLSYLHPSDQLKHQADTDTVTRYAFILSLGHAARITSQTFSL